VTFSNLLSSINVWGRGVATVGWSPEEVYDNTNYHFGLGFCEAVPGSVTACGATLRTYVYEVWNDTGSTYYGYYPCMPESVQLTYVVHGIQAIPANLSISKGGSGGVLHPLLKWNGISGTEIDGYKIYRSYSEQYLPFLLRATTTDTSYLDNGVVWSDSTSNEGEAWYYVTSYHGTCLESAPSSVESVDCIQCPVYEPEKHTVAADIIPRDYSLRCNFPNPFNPSTTIAYDIPTEAEVTITICDVLGREIITLVHEHKPAGMYTAHWNAANMPSGVYYCRMTAGSFSQMRKLLLLR
jgi:hypothetical protein